MSDLSTVINLPYNFKPWYHQLDAWNAMINANIKRMILVWHRRAGKDILAFNVLICKAMERVGIYWIVFPEYTQGRQIIWEGQTDSGRKFIDFIPTELIARKRDDTMFIELINGSVIKIIGSDRADSIVGTNPVGVIFSEYSIQNPRAWNLVRPILNANNGWAIFVYTPRGYNHGHDLYLAATEQMEKDPNRWFCQLLTIKHTSKMLIDETGQYKTDEDGNVLWGPIVTPEMIEEDLATGMQPELVDQEYHCSFDAALVGSYYGDQIATARKNTRMTVVPYVPDQPVHTAWDLGKSDATAVWFFQRIKEEYRWINYQEWKGKSFQEILKAVKEMPYVYGSHLAPHDVKVSDYTSKESRWTIAKNLGIPFIIVPKLSIQDGIDAVRRVIPNSYFDSEKCAQGIACLSQYQKTWNETLKQFSDAPLHNWCSHGADAFRTAAVGMHFIRDNLHDNFNPPGVSYSQYNVYSHSGGFEDRYIAGNEYDIIS
jgi:phage terminase large subunit